MRPPPAGAGIAARARSWVPPAAALLLILLVTLPPRAGDAPSRGIFCLLCGARGTSEAILNALLFLPLGLALAHRWGGARPDRLRRTAALVAATLAAALVSLGLETVQLGLPGRTTSLGDFLFNTLGAAAGTGAWLWRDAWLHPAAERAAALCVAAGAAATAVLALTAFALGTAPTRADYWGQWTPDLGHLEAYGGRVVDGRVGDVLVPPGRYERSDTLRALIRRGARVRVTAAAGPPPPALAPIFSLYDGEQREIVLLGADRRDLVFRHRRRAAELRLDAPDARLRGAFATVAPGDTIRLTAFVEAGSRCLIAAPVTGGCGLGPSLADGWALLRYPEHLPAAGGRALGALWITALFLPIGLWLRRRSPCALAVLLPVGGLLLLPAVAAPETTPVVAWLAAVGGLTGGAAIAARLRA